MTYTDATIYNFLYKFQINSLGIENLNANYKRRLNITPNPCTSHAKLSYTTVEDGLVTIEIFSITGTKTDRLKDQFERQGQHEFTWNTENLPAGIYFCELQSGGVRTIEKLIKIK